jgi:tRNA modification GTPase
MFSTTDTIVAIATPAGRGGIGVVRLSGASAHAIAVELLARASPLEPRHATLGEIRGGDAAIDQAIVTYFPAPASYTGDDVVEISAHGSPVVLRGIVEAAIDRGARLAEPGEFTLRAYLNGRIDLPQAEAIGDLIDAVTPLQARSAFDQMQGTLTRAIAEIDRTLFDLIARLEASVDFPEEGYHFVDPAAVAAGIDGIADRMAALLAGARRGRLLREGLQIAIVGSPNVGKSSLFNALVGAERAIVTAIPGTTRDLVSETIDLEGLRVTLIDTAGLRNTDDVVEIEGVARSRGAANVADLILNVSDQSRAFAPFPGNALLVANKSDIGVGHVSDPDDLPNTLPVVATQISNHTGGVPSPTETHWVGDLSDPVRVSALTGEGLDELRRRIVEALDIELLADRPEITNVRHIALVERARDSLIRARHAALSDGQSLSEEFVLADLQDARAALEEITGKRAPEDLLAHIFARFCIGK